MSASNLPPFIGPLSFQDLNDFFQSISSSRPSPSMSSFAAFSDFLKNGGSGNMDGKLRELAKARIKSIIEDPAYISQAKARGVDFTVATPGCDCLACEIINERHDAAASADVPAPAREDAGKSAAPDFATAPGAPSPGEMPRGPRPPDVAAILREGADTFEERNKLYGDSYKRYGNVMMALFPDGIEVFTTDDFNRFGIFHMMVSKMTRLASNLHAGGHRDSSLDLGVYSAMLTELTEERK